MPVRVVVSGVVLVVLTAFLVFMVEFFLPLSAKSDMNHYCRSTLLKMESEGGLSPVEEQALKARLAEDGFTGVIVSGTPSAKQGRELRLHVEADYGYSKLTALFVRSSTAQRMVYDKSSIARKVVN